MTDAISLDFPNLNPIRKKIHDCDLFNVEFLPFLGLLFGFFSGIFRHMSICEKFMHVKMLVGQAQKNKSTSPFGFRVHIVSLTLHCLGSIW